MDPRAATLRPDKRGRRHPVWRPKRKAQPAKAPPHVEVLRSGVRAWNAWRRENPGLVPLLNDLDVSITERQFGRVQGGPINLGRAEFRRARLDQATLIEANLIGAVLTEADLSDARLERADLRGARLAYTALGGAQLEGANLCGADLRLSRGLTQAQIDQAVGDCRTALPTHLTIPKAWLRQCQPRQREAPASLGYEAPRGLHSARVIAAAAMAAAIGIGALAAWI